jgi:hypothetical protein
VIVGHSRADILSRVRKGPASSLRASKIFSDQKFFFVRSKISIVEQARREGLLVAFSAANRCTPGSSPGAGFCRKMLYAHSRSFSNPL